MVVVTLDVTTMVLARRRSRSSSRSTGVVQAKNSLMPKLDDYLWIIWQSLGA